MDAIGWMASMRYAALLIYIATGPALLRGCTRSAITLFNVDPVYSVLDTSSNARGERTPPKSALPFTPFSQPRDNVTPTTTHNTCHPTKQITQSHCSAPWRMSLK